MNLIDPDGKDIYYVNYEGEITYVEDENFENDLIVLATKEGTKSIELPGGSIRKNVERGSITGESQAGPVTMDYTILDIDGDDNAIQFFEFMADNTDLEWSHVKIGEKGRNKVGTSHRVNSSVVNGKILEDGYHIREDIHNHPSGDPSASPDDGAHARNVLQRYPNAKLYIYTTGNGYAPYP